MLYLGMAHLCSASWLARAAAAAARFSSLACVCAVVVLAGPQAANADPHAADADPIQPARMIAEWEPAWGVLIRWPLNIPVELVREISEEDTVYTLVEGSGNENSARSTFQSAGVVMDHVRFIQTDVYSSWTRDWGPQCVFDGDGQMGIADPWFDGYPWVPGCQGRGAEWAGPHPAKVARCGKLGAPGSGGPSCRGAPSNSSVLSEPSRLVRARGYEDDDVIPGDVAAFLGVPHHLMPAYCTGGNIMTDGHGRAFSTDQMFAENSAYMSESAFRATAETFLGITDYQFLSNPEVHGIQHIDCYAKLLDEETVIVKEVPTWHPEYDCIETLVDEFAVLGTCYGGPYDIVRIWCEPYSGNAAAGYTNSLIINKKVLVPTFGVSADATALATYADAMPGYEVIGLPHTNWYYYDALHCRTMSIFDAGMLRMSHARLRGVLPAAPSHEVEVDIDAMSGAGLLPGAQVVRWRLEGETSWNEEPLSPSRKSSTRVGMESASCSGAAREDSFVGYIPGQTPGDVVEYYVSASDSSGRMESLPRTAPVGFYSFQIDPSSGVDEGAWDGCAVTSLALSANPTPFASSTTISYTLPSAAHVRLALYDVSGRLVAEVVNGDQGAGPHEIQWGVGSAAGALASGATGIAAARSGVYFARLEAAGQTAVRKLVLLR